MDMIEKVAVVLDCCSSSCEIVFDDRECPATAPFEVRKNVSCPQCESFLILSLRRNGSERHVGQEIIERNS